MYKLQSIQTCKINKSCTSYKEVDMENKQVYYFLSEPEVHLKYIYLNSESVPLLKGCSWICKNVHG